MAMLYSLLPTTTTKKMETNKELDPLPFPAGIYTTPPLPLEITDYIIDIVATQRAKWRRSDLAACSLVCRAWTQRSRLHFFSDCRLLLHYYNAPKFGRLLASPHCTILPHVRRLTMEGTVIFDDIKEELKLLQRVESLKLTGKSWAAHGAPPRRGFMASLATVLELDIDCADLGEFDHALLVICAFPALRRLSLPSLAMPTSATTDWNGTLFHPYEPYVPSAWLRLRAELIRPPPLVELSIKAPAIVPILHWLNWTGSCHGVVRLDLELPVKMGSWDSPPLVEFLRNSCDTLEHLKLGCAAMQLHNIAEVFDLGSHPSLRTLSFNLTFPDGDQSPLEGSLLSIVQSIGSSIFESVSFTLDDNRLLHRIQASPLDEFFSNSTFNLKLVTFSRSGEPSASDGVDFATSVKELFPRIAARGLLSLQVPGLKVQ
jgi:hypothetical protein